MDSALQRPSPEYARSSACWCCDVACQGPALTLMWPRCAQAFRCRDWATLVERSHWRMTATTCYDMLLQSTTAQRLKETQSFGRRAVSTPRGLGTSGDAAPAASGGRPGSEEAEDSGTSQAPSTAQARPRPRAELRPQPRKWPARFRGLAGPRAASPLDEHCLSVDPAAQLHNADEV